MARNICPRQKGNKGRELCPALRLSQKVESKMSFSGLSLNFPRCRAPVHSSCTSPSPVRRAVPLCGYVPGRPGGTVLLRGWPAAALGDYGLAAVTGPLTPGASALLAWLRKAQEAHAFLSRGLHVADSSFSLCPGLLVHVAFSFQVKSEWGSARAVPVPGSTGHPRRMPQAVPSGAADAGPVGVRR